MTSTSRIVDIDTLIQLPEARAVATAIRLRWDLWIGLVTRAGRVLPVAGPDDSPLRRPSLPVCDQFMRRSDNKGSCALSLASWAGRAEPDSASCHAHLDAVVVPLGLDDSSGAAVFASGFLSTERHVEQIAGLLERADELGLLRPSLSHLLASIPRLDPAERRAVRQLLETMAAAIRRGSRTSDPGPPLRHDYSHIIGNSPEMLRLYEILDRVVESDSTILIEGENGTGKELFARAVHANSRRKNRAFVTQNCSDINDNLLESELFGHRRGAFTGAIADKGGLFERADGGTLFLDEVADMSPAMQVKLLRFLQEGTFLPVGDTVTHKVDVRVIAATNRNLQEMVAQGAFREDLYYRIDVINLVVPPLRQRRSDIPLLVDHYLGAMARRANSPKKRLADDTMSLFMIYDWPGNVRELRHEVERLVVLGGDDRIIRAELLSPRIRRATAPNAAGATAGLESTLPEAVAALERQMIAAALEQTDWNKTHAARRLGISRRNLIRKVQSHGLRPPDDESA